MPMYDHPHSYMVTAWAIDENGLVEQSRPTRTFCVRDAGVTTCGGAIRAARWPRPSTRYCALHTDRSRSSGTDGTRS